MKRLSALVALAVAALALAAAVGATAASATTYGVLCKTAPTNLNHECITPYAGGTELTATLEKPFTVRNSSGIALAQCTGSTLGFRYNGENGLEYKSGTFSGCSRPTKKGPGGEFVTKWREGTDSGTFNWIGGFFSTELSGSPGFETYGFPGETQGIELVGGSSPKLVFTKSPLVGSSGQSTSLTLDATYELSPTPIDVEKWVAPAVLCNSSSCLKVYPAGTEFTATQVSGETMSIKGALNETWTSCKSSAIHLRYDGANRLEFLSSSYSECTRPTKDASNGLFLVRQKENAEKLGGSGLLVEISEVPVVGTGQWGPTGEGIFLVEGATPQLKFDHARMVPSPGAPGGALYMYGNYNLTPTPLFTR